MPVPKTSVWSGSCSLVLLTVITRAFARLSFFFFFFSSGCFLGFTLVLSVFAVLPSREGMGSPTYRQKFCGGRGADEGAQ